MESHRTPERLLPLKAPWFHILVSLADGPVHGYAVRQEVEERTSGRVKLWPATLYGSIRLMEEQGLIEEVGAPEEVEDADERRRYWGLTPWGRRVLAAETDRLATLVQAARATRALREA